MIHCEHGTSGYHKGLDEGEGFVISSHLIAGGYSGDCSGQKLTRGVTFSSSATDLCIIECFGSKRLKREHDKFLGEKRPLEPLKHYELGVSVAQEVPKSLCARKQRDRREVIYYVACLSDCFPQNPILVSFASVQHRSLVPFLST